MNMKKDYIKPRICIDSFEIMSCILEMSYGGDSEGSMESRQRYTEPYDGNNKRGYGSNGGRNSGWGSLW